MPSSSWWTAISNKLRRKSRNKNSNNATLDAPTTKAFTSASRTTMNGSLDKKKQPFRIRIKIRDQLSVLVAITSLAAIGALAGVTWHNNLNYVTSSRAERLSLIADLKSSQLSQAISTYLTSVQALASRTITISALDRYSLDNNNTDANWNHSLSDVGIALSTQPFLLQATIWNTNLTAELLNVTSENAYGTIVSSAGSLGQINSFGATGGYNWDGHVGFSDDLYPRNSVINSTDPIKVATLTPEYIIAKKGVLLGPVQFNGTLYLASLTVPIWDSPPNGSVLLGFMTVALNAQFLWNVINNTANNQGEAMVVGPASLTNTWPNNTVFTDDVVYRYVLPPISDLGLYGENDTLGHFPAALKAFQRGEDADSDSIINTRNAQNEKVSVGFVALPVTLADWAIVVQMDYADVVQPIIHIRNILIATVFATCGAILILVVPIAHWAVRDIAKLQSATEFNSILYSDDGNGHMDPNMEKRASSGLVEDGLVHVRTSPLGTSPESPASTRSFRIPSKIPERKHIIYDELTDLTHTFNEMTDLLQNQYENLEERVRDRTSELEAQKKIAETANDAKTIFLANITHELRTPLNGILGMCAVCTNETDLTKIRRSLQIISKSGEILLGLLTDLLNFSRNQVGHHVVLTESQFCITDLTSQIHSIFEKQAVDKHIDFHISVRPERRVVDMNLWGDSNRITQVLMNLISNSLKFTPAKGSVSLKMKLLGPQEIEEAPSLRSPRSSSEEPSRSTLSKILSKTQSFTGKARPQSMPSRPISQVTKTTTSTMGGNSLLVTEEKLVSQDDISSIEDGVETMPANYKTYMFEFTVEDTGPGVRPDMHEKIFEPFVQGDRGLSRRYGGTGLGLSIARQLAELMKGTVKLQRSSDQGSSFSMVIPLKATADVAASITSKDGLTSTSRRSSVLLAHPPLGTNLLSENPYFSMATNYGTAAVISEEGTQISPARTTFPEPIPDIALERKPSDTEILPVEKPIFKIPLFLGQLSPPNATEAGIKALEAQADRGMSLRVLIAEDNKVNQEVVIRMLKLEKIVDVTVAADGQEAIDQVKSAMAEGRQFHIVFMDVQMPNVDGLDATRTIRGLGYDGPIVALTAYNEASNVKACYDSGMVDFIAKPIKRPALKKALKTYCSTILEEDLTPGSEMGSFMASPCSENPPSLTGTADNSPLVKPSSN